jgi:hypothetical protein
MEGREEEVIVLEKDFACYNIWYDSYCYNLKPYSRGTRTNKTLDTYEIGIRYKDYNTILYNRLISTSVYFI